jgi:hypothetical protein
MDHRRSNYQPAAAYKSIYGWLHSRQSSFETSNAMRGALFARHATGSPIEVATA